MTLIAYAFAAAAVILAGLHLDLRSRHRRCKATLERVAAERDAARASAWEQSQLERVSPRLLGHG